MPVTIDYSQGSLEVKMSYDPEVIRKLKYRIPKRCREWDPVKKCWYVSPGYLKELVDILRLSFSVYDIFISEDIPQFSRLSEILGGTTSHRRDSAYGKDSACSELYLLPDAPEEIVKAVYKAMCKLHHPDVGGNLEKMKRINQAYDKLSRRN